MANTTVTQLPAPAPPPRLSITESVARQYGMEPAPFEKTLRATVVPAATTREEFAAFLLVAKHYGLNPILREIYAFPKKGGGIQPIVGVDGWAAMLNRQPAFDGMAFHDIFEDGKLVAITCSIYRKDRKFPISTTEYLDECVRYERDFKADKSGAAMKVSEVWAKWPRRMLRHKSMIQAARYAFGFSGIVDPDEFDRFGASPHDPAMLQAQMQIESGTADLDDKPPPADDNPFGLPPIEDFPGDEDRAAINGEPPGEPDDVRESEFADEPVEEGEPWDETPREQLLAQARQKAFEGPQKLSFFLGALPFETRDLLTPEDIKSLRAAATKSG